MATINDILDWLNQGAQGDIPGTGSEQPNAPTVSAPAPPPPGTSQPSPQEQPPPGQAQPSAQEAGEKGRQAGQKAGQGLWAMLFGKQPQKTPQDYTSDIPPTSMMHYQALVSQGIPPDVARYILTQPSLGEGETRSAPWPQNYQGWQQDFADEQANYGKVPLEEHMRDVRRAQQQNLPTQDGSTAGDNATSGLQQLPTGQYVPYPSQGLDYWAAQGNPQSFYWNPQPGSSWLNDLLGDQ